MVAPFYGADSAEFSCRWKVAPNYKVPGDAYLDYDRVFYSEQVKQDCLNDPMLLPYYPIL